MTSNVSSTQSVFRCLSQIGQTIPYLSTSCTMTKTSQTLGAGDPEMGLRPRQSHETAHSAAIDKPRHSRCTVLTCTLFIESCLVLLAFF